MSSSDSPDVLLLLLAACKTLNPKPSRSRSRAVVDQTSHGWRIPNLPGRRWVSAGPITFPKMVAEVVVFWRSAMAGGAWDGHRTAKS